MPALATSLHRPDVRRALEAALDLDAPTIEALTPKIARWDSQPLLRRLTDAGELVDGRWCPQSRDRYRTLITGANGNIGISGKALDRLTEGERPREKALRAGVAELDDAELVALLLRTGVGDEGVLELAQRLLADVGGLVGLARSEVTALTELRGVGEAKASELAAACELGRRLAAAALRERPRLDSPESVAAFLAPLTVSLPHEQMWCLPLDPRCGLIGAPRVVSQGDVDSTDVPVKAVLRAALSAGASLCIVVHNHPTGDPSPSPSDLACTRRLIAAARAIDLPIQDHVVLGDGGRFASLRRLHPDLWRA